MMHSRSLIFIGIACLVLMSACKRRERIPVQLTEEEAPTLASVIHAGDPNAAKQFLKGFHEIEQNSWRWTTRSFSVLLRPPRSGAEKGAKLELHISVPDPVLNKLKSVTLSAAIEGLTLKPETYQKSGDYVYSRDVPGKVLGAEVVKIDFTLDKFLPAGSVDQRELGLVVTSAGFEVK